jgi:hypothetical protein
MFESTYVLDRWFYIVHMVDLFESLKMLENH